MSWAAKIPWSLAGPPPVWSQTKVIEGIAPRMAQEGDLLADGHPVTKLRRLLMKQRLNVDI